MLFEARRPALPAEGLVLLDSTPCKAHRVASGAARSSPKAEALGRSRGGLCSFAAQGCAVHTPPKRGMAQGERVVVQHAAPGRVVEQRRFLHLAREPGWSPGSPVMVRLP